MSDPRPAELRWEAVEKNRFRLADGTEFTVEGGEKVLEAIAQLPHHYIELGQAAADLKLDVEFERRKNESLRYELDRLSGRLDHLGDEERQKKLLVILQEDLEKALNMLIRYAYALGIQEGGLLYDEVQSLVTKYKMYYRPPTGYDYNQLTSPVIHPVLEGREVKELEQ